MNHATPRPYRAVSRSTNRLNHPNTPPLAWPCPFSIGFSIVAQSAGVSERASRAEKAMEVTIAIENCR